ETTNHEVLVNAGAGTPRPEIKDTARAGHPAHSTVNHAVRSAYLMSRHRGLSPLSCRGGLSPTTERPHAITLTNCRTGPDSLVRRRADGRRLDAHAVPARAGRCQAGAAAAASGPCPGACRSCDRVAVTPGAEQLRRRGDTATARPAAPPVPSVAGRGAAPRPLDAVERRVSRDVPRARRVSGAAPRGGAQPGVLRRQPERAELERQHAADGSHPDVAGAGPERVDR